MAKKWALVLGASSGFGGAVSIKFAKEGYNIFGVHLDRKQTMPIVNETIAAIESHGAKAVYFNINAADEALRGEALEKMKQEMGEGDEIQMVLHSLAFGALVPLVYDAENDKRMSEKQLTMTLDVMANAIIFWVQALMGKDMLHRGAHIFTMTSAGGHRAWPNYGAVSGAKAASEAYIRQLALELAPLGIAANAIQAGVTDTAALRKIPGSDKMIDMALSLNPGNRLTSPEDVADIMYSIAQGTTWVTGNVIRADGGEDIVG
jgi:enoyl-[acyl-carrier protein] reductase III